MTVSAFSPLLRAARFIGGLLRADGAERLGLLGLGAILIIAGAEVAGPVLLGLAVTDLAAPSLPETPMAGLWALLLAGGFVVCRLLSGGLGAVRDHALYRLGRRLNEAVALRAVDHLSRRGPGQRPGPGAEPVNRGVEAAYGVTEALAFGVLPVLVQAAGVAVVLLVVAGPLYALLGLGGAALYTAVVAGGLARQAPVIARLNADYTGIEDAVTEAGADGAASRVRSRLAEGFAGVREADQTVARLHLRCGLLEAAVLMATLAAVVGLSADAVLAGAAPVGLLVMVAALTVLLFTPLRGMVQQAVVAGRQAAGLMPLIDLLETPEAVANGGK